MAGDSIRIKSRTNIKGGTSPWIYFTDTYPNGDRAILFSNSTHVFKLLDDGENIIAIDSMRVDFDAFSSFGYNLLLTKNKVWFTYDPKFDLDDDQFTYLYKIGDEDPTDVYSDLIYLDTFNFWDHGIKLVQQYSMNYNGEIVFNVDKDQETNRGMVGIVSQDFQLLDTLSFATAPNEIVDHNGFPIDEENAFYIVTTHRMIKFAWDGQDLSMDWEVPYDFVADGPTGIWAEGSGTTPTLLGWGAGNDQLVVVSDGHAQNNLVGFWREIPPDWMGIPGKPLRYAGSIALPAAETFSNFFQSIENSPTAFGYDIGIAQFNGFLGYDCDNVKGVQKIRWDTTNNTFQIAWVNTDINMNGVMTYSHGANTVYCSGKEADCNYYYYGLDWDTGEVIYRQLLGPEASFLDDTFYDAGSANIIDEEGSIYFPGGSSLVKVEIVERVTNVEESTPVKSLSIFPNPTTGVFNVDAPGVRIQQIEVLNTQGKRLIRQTNSSSEINLNHLPTGIYIIQVKTEQGQFTEKLIKQ